MIISASRRTDIPAFYAKWFVNRLCAGYCNVPNPFNTKQITRVSLCVEDVDAIVFWSRNPRPLFPYLEELERRGYRYVFNFTILNNPRLLDANSPDVESSIRTFRELSDRVGADRLTWRYDPIVLSSLTSVDFHRRNFEAIAKSLQGYCKRCVISLVNLYRKSLKRLNDLAGQGLVIHTGSNSEIASLLRFISETAHQCAMDVFSCAQEADFSTYGIKAGKCIDARHLSEVFRVELETQRDPHQRKHCGCDTSKDIGMYDSCLFDCRYCYATSSHERAKTNYRRHDVNSPSLLGWYS